jgi:predicted N-acyltransferase
MEKVMRSEEMNHVGQDSGQNHPLLACQEAAAHYVTQVFVSPRDIAPSDWDALLSLEPAASPFMKQAYLSALHDSGCAQHATGWQPQFVTLWQDGELQAACPLYLKNHSYGEYVFDWAWANAYARHGLDYFPKAVVAVPFTPVPGARLLARSTSARVALVQALISHARQEQLSSLHLLFLSAADRLACEAAGLMLRHTVQFHWSNPGAETGQGYADFEHFLARLQQEKRKKIRQERRKVADAGVVFRWAVGSDISPSDWAFFYRCYARTYQEHGNPPYLSTAFFQQIAQQMPEHWLLFVAERNGQPIASSLIGIDPVARVAYGRYWGALERVDCLHFEACYYQPLAWCIAHGYVRFEGGAQGEHKMARALLPVNTTSAHWLAHPAFAQAVERFLAQETEGIGQYLTHLAQRNPLKHATQA